MKRFGIAVLVGLTLALSGLVPTVASANSMTWHVRSESPRTVHLQFYSNTHVWPSSSRVYVIDDYATHDYKLSCSTGEKVCYGAWVKNNSASYWGSGYDGEQACDSCCFICGGGPLPTMVLNR